MSLKKIYTFMALATLTVATFAQESFNPLNFVSFKKNLTYVQGEDSQTYTVERTLNPYAINKFETTYRLWYEIRVMAEKRGYVFQNPGQPGSHGKRAVVPNAENENQPVTMINWYDAIVWCNALSEIKGKTPCYTYNGKVLKDAQDSAACDLCECNWNADGFRLPSESEWEYAARKTKKGMAKGDRVSGQKTGDYEEGQRYAWISDNCINTKIVGTAGLPFNPEEVSRPATGNANEAGLYDMSGNVMEYCWDWNGDYSSEYPYGIEMGYDRICRGGSWSPYTMFAYAGDRYGYDPNETYNYMGFRLAYSIVTTDGKTPVKNTVSAY